MTPIEIITIGRLGGLKMFNTTTLKAGIGVAVGFFVYMSFIKPSVPFLR